MEIVIISVFVMGYLAITLEHSLKLDKLIPALIMMAVCWALVALGVDHFTNWFDASKHGLVDGFAAMAHDDKLHLVEETLLHHLGKTAEILVFLLGAMTIVEIIDYFDGFSTIKGYVNFKSKKKLLWMFSILAFILSAIIDNLTATIVLISILQKIIKKRDDRIWFAGLIIIAANAGGAFSPIGDVTTTMLWIGDKVSTGMLFIYLFIPSLLCMLVPTFIATFLPSFKGEIDFDEHEVVKNKSPHSARMLYLGLGAILFVPIFKTVTHLPPYVGMLLSLGVLWLVTEILHRSKNHEQKAVLSVIGVLKKIDVPTIFFFLGILLAVASLQSAGQLDIVATFLDKTFNGDIYIINIIIGLLSSIVDNVPLVAGAMGMYEITPMGDFAVDGKFWEFLAYCAGTGGSVLIIGSAAGVAVMGILKIDFIWYIKNISLLALMGYLAGAATYIFMQ